MRIVLSLIFGLLITNVGIGQENLERWFHLDPSSGHMGVSADKTYDELLKGKSSLPVIVAIIDSGVDAEHEDLKDVMWTNPGEIPGNGIDDDKNGYIDDIHGWNFIGGPDGKNVNEDTYEVTRLYGKYKYKYENADPNLLSKKDKEEYERFQVYKKEVDAKREAAADAIIQTAETETMINTAFDSLEVALANAEMDFTLENIQALETDNQQVVMGKNIAARLMSRSPNVSSMKALKKEFKGAIEEQKEHYNKQLSYAYNPDFDPRKTIVKDDYSNPNERYYGNNDVEGPDALHGTHVAGIVAAVRGNGIGMDGVADNVQIMSVRAVPNGDERDKDVANAIRYAVDNGAQIINMSFGKGFSWNKEIVDDAVKHAEKNDVLLVHAAGNSALNTDENDNFPNDQYDKAGGWWFFNKNVDNDPWIEVGALSHNANEDQVASFSNYAKENVDIFAPGQQIYSTLPNNKYRYLQGTSMAAPVVAGVAAVLRSYFPTLTAEQTKDIIMETATPLDMDVKVPGADGELGNFTELSKSGGVINLYKAVQKAMTVKGKKKVKNLEEKLKAASM